MVVREDACKSLNVSWKVCYFALRTISENEIDKARCVALLKAFLKTYRILW